MRGSSPRMTAVIVGLFKTTTPNHSAHCCLAVHASGRFSINGDFIFLFLRDSRSCEVAKVVALSTR
jgi:hypothetical protein